MHVCFSIRWKCRDVLIECFAAWLHQNLLCLNHNTSIWILLKMQAPLMLSVLYYSHVVEWMYVYVREKVRWCVCLCCCSANERLGVSGFQVLMLWERRWVTGLMNSDVRQLLINQETVCQPADWNSSPSPMCTHACVHKHTQTWKTIIRTSQFNSIPMFPTTYTHTCSRVHIPFTCACSGAEASPALPSWHLIAVCLLLVCSHSSHRDKALTEYGNICQM